MEKEIEEIIERIKKSNKYITKYTYKDINKLIKYIERLKLENELMFKTLEILPKLLED